MPSQFAGYSGVPDPCEILLGASGQILLHTLADTSITWQDGTPGTIPADTLASSVYGGASVNGVADVYYALAVKGSAIPVLVKEKDISIVDSLLGGSPLWAKWQRIANGEPFPTPQP